MQNGYDMANVTLITPHILKYSLIDFTFDINHLSMVNFPKILPSNLQ